MLTDLEVSMHYAHVVEVFDSVEDLLNELTGIFLCVEASLYDPIEEFPSRHPAPERMEETGRTQPTYLTDLNIN